MNPSEIQNQSVETKYNAELIIRAKKTELEHMIHKNIMEELQFMKDNKIKQFVRK